MKHILGQWRLLPILAVAFVIPAAASGQQLAATITFLDGTSLILDSPRLIYRWKPWSLTNCVNCAREAPLAHFNYLELGPQRETLRQIPLGDIRRVVFSYREEKLDTDASDITAILERVVITENGGAIRSTGSDLFGKRNQMPSELAGNSADPAVFWELLVEGRPTRSGGRQEFRRTIITPGRTAFVLRPQRPNEHCETCIPRSGVIREISFSPR